MGSFYGHALPGSFFMIYAFWLAINACIRLGLSARRGVRFVSTTAYTCPPACGRLHHWPIEPVVKMFFSFVGLTAEIVTAMEDGRFAAIGNAQHATMFFYFGFSGVIDLLVHYKAPLPPNTDYVIFSMAFMVESLLFKFHLHGRTQLDVLVHTLLIYVVYACVISVLVEMKYRHSILSPLARAYFILLQGTWFWQVGFILYNPFPGAVAWKADDHRELTLATLYFVWHALANFILLVGLAVAIHVCMRGWGRSMEAESDISMKRLISAESTDETVVDLQEEGGGESDLEVQQPLVSHT